ncbi:hypothetical protein BC937DRAFT_88586 [Endogone sp. FLAS-F59071]|nr:hypothetical protein BC937DRAFT_88586 [Endogone sp. FLAS-F59071]|eukprot:RUS22526.1 hypothetical protein BC937DRAFT_88586 [Endogone sp. FLAS-F59071]
MAATISGIKPKIITERSDILSHVTPSLFVWRVDIHLSKQDERFKRLEAVVDNYRKIKVEVELQGEKLYGHQSIVTLGLSIGTASDLAHLRAKNTHWSSFSAVDHYDSEGERLSLIKGHLSILFGFIGKQPANDIDIGAASGTIDTGYGEMMVWSALLEAENESGSTHADSILQGAIYYLKYWCMF